MKKIGSKIWGIVLIVLGLIFALNALEITDLNIFFNGWWTLFIIVPSIVGIFNDDDKTASVIWLIIGIFLLLVSQRIVAFDLIWKLLFPAILVLIGISILFKDSFKGKIKKEILIIRGKQKETNEHWATFGEIKLDLKDEEFTGADLNAIFGSITLDLTKSIIKKDVVINATSIFGGIKILVPEGVMVKINPTSIFGGVTNKYPNGKDSKAKTIYISSICVFGGVDIK